MIQHRCGHRGCRKYVPIDKRYCDEHAPLHQYKRQPKEQKKRADKHYNQYQRDPEANEFYHSNQWTKVRDYVYARDMATCQVCGNAITDRKIVDHIHALKVAPDEKLNSDNLWTLCYRCHNVKTKLEQSIESKPNGANKLKHISKQWWIKTIKERIK